jgi:predicted Rossmann fold nucleotide-binding protein DprA/Smf involved in DNA uptake
LLERIEDMGMRVSRHGQAGYPTQLLEDPDPPVAFFAVGADLLVGGLPRVAVVGTRRCSGYGSDVRSSWVGTWRPPAWSSSPAWRWASTLLPTVGH